MVSKVLNLADVFIAPSYHEPFGQVFLEAMAVEVPVIATKSGGPLNFVISNGKKANGWLSNVDHANDLSKSIYESVMDKGERRRRGQNARSLAVKNYSWGNIAGRLEKLYKAVLVRNKTPILV